jgi:hypothetical protein
MALASTTYPTESVITRHDPVRPGARGLNGGHGHETYKVLLAILYLIEGQKSS